MLGCLPISTIFGAAVQIEQSLVGNVLSNFTIDPPIEGDLSNNTTLNPLSATSRAACIPPIPAPIMSTSRFSMMVGYTEVL